MSPASSGALEVEKYIGACLISQSRPKSTARDYFARPETYPGTYVGFRVQRGDRWAGGMPLISFANHQKTRSTSPKEDHPNPLARLAVHTQGAPLILTKSFHRKGKGQKNVVGARAFDTRTKLGNQSVGVDSVSVTSDESSGSAHSDNCLPRIIKPRKRRKKDRKPGLLPHSSTSQDGFSTDSASPDIDPVSMLKPYTPFVFDSHRLYGTVPEQEKLDIFNDAPQLHHTFEDVEEVEDAVDINGNQSMCQCRYCDPSGQIWDVDRNCYSPFLTPIRERSFPYYEPDYLKPSSSLETNCLIHGMALISLGEEKEQKNNEPKKLSTSSRDLEVSTEIVTSLNGHRDIEIKFFSSSSGCDRSVNSFVENVRSHT